MKGHTNDLAPPIDHERQVLVTVLKHNLVLDVSFSAFQFAFFLLFTLYVSVKGTTRVLKTLVSQNSVLKPLVYP